MACKAGCTLALVVDAAPPPRTQATGLQHGAHRGFVRSGREAKSSWSPKPEPPHTAYMECLSRGMVLFVSY